MLRITKGLEGFVSVELEEDDFREVMEDMRGKREQSKLLEDKVSEMLKGMCVITDIVDGKFKGKD